MISRYLDSIDLKEGNKSVLGGVPKGLPAMVKAHRIQEKAKQVGFEWDTREQVWDKIEEEIAELKEQIKQVLSQLKKFQSPARKTLEVFAKLTPWAFVIIAILDKLKLWG